MKYYIILEPNEDGNPHMIFDETKLSEILESRSDGDVVSFKEFLEKQDTNYWEEGAFFIAEIVPVKVRQIKTLAIDK